MLCLWGVGSDHGRCFVAEVVGPDPNPKRKTKSWAYAVRMYVTNMAKWEAARKYCKKKGWEFKIVTEYELGLKKRPK